MIQYSKHSNQYQFLLHLSDINIWEYDKNLPNLCYHMFQRFYYTFDIWLNVEKESKNSGLRQYSTLIAVVICLYKADWPL